MFSSVLLFFDVGGGEILFIMMVALLLFGGDKLPGLARGLGKGIRDFKDASEGVKREINNQIDNFETKKAQPATNVAETAAASAVVANNSVPVAEINSDAVQPKENETAADLGHLNIDHNAPQANTEPGNEPAHQEYKS